MYQLRTQDSVSVLRLFREQAEKQRELGWRKRSSYCVEEMIRIKWVRLLAHGLTNKLIHQPTVQVRRASAEGHRSV